MELLVKAVKNFTGAPDLSVALLAVSQPRHYSQLAADPPDPNFQQAVTLNVTPVAGDFEEAQNAGDPVWALRHAEELKSYAQLLAASLSRQSTASSELQSALDTSPVDLTRR